MCAWKYPWPDRVRCLFPGYCEDEEVTSATHFNCSDLYYDGGDCLMDSVTGCFADHSPDCLGQCAPLWMTANDGTSIGVSRNKESWREQWFGQLQCDLLIESALVT